MIEIANLLNAICLRDVWLSVDFSGSQSLGKPIRSAVSICPSKVLELCWQPNLRVGRVDTQRYTIVPQHVACVDRQPNHIF